MAGGHTSASEGSFAHRRREPRPLGPRLQRLGFVVGALAVVVGGLWWADDTDVFAITRVETGAYRYTEQVALDAQLAELLGRRLWLLRTDEIVASVESLPWVRRVSVRRRLPATLMLELEEWRPLLAVATAGAADHQHVMLEDGRVVIFPEHLAAPALPVLLGVETARDSTGAERLDVAQRDLVLDLIAAVEASGLESACPVDFLVARDGGFAIVLQDGAGSLLVGREDFRDRLARYLVARDHLEAGLEVDLRFRDRVTVRRPEP